MDESEFKNLIERYQGGTLSPKEKMLVDRWFASLAEDVRDETWTVERKPRLRQDLISAIATEDKAPPKHKFVQYAYRIAASLLIVVSMSYVIWQYAGVGKNEATSDLNVAASMGMMKKVVLPDKSIVWLKGNSTLTYPGAFSGQTRGVTLVGEALFEVSKDPTRPFVIECGDLITTVLGTSFNIRSGIENIEVLVLTGKVSLTSRTDKTGIVVLPNEKALYLVDKKKIAKVDTKVPKNESKSVVVGTEYAMNFEDTRMEVVARRIEGKYNVRLVMEEPAIGNCLITADFTDQSLDRTLDMIAQALGFKYEVADGEITIAGEGCP